MAFSDVFHYGNYCGPNWSNERLKALLPYAAATSLLLMLLMLYVQYTITRMLADIRFGRLI